MRRTLFIVQMTAIAVAVISGLLILFVLGDTDIAAPSTTPGFEPNYTILCAVVASLGAVVAGVIQWVGVPPEEENKGEGKKRSGRRHGRPSK